MRNDLRTYVEIDLDAIAANIQAAKDRVEENVKMCAVIKTNGYGHGAVAIAHYLEQDVDYYAVACVEEAIELREAGIKLPILILGYTLHAQYENLVRYDITQVIFTLEDAKALSETATGMGKTAKIHIAVDTGMGRIGFMPVAEDADTVKEISLLPSLILEGMFTHFATADETDKTYTMEQMERFDAFAALLEARGVNIPLKHCCNSAGIMEFDHHRFQMVRSGITTYGLYPSEEVDFEAMKLIPAMTWKAHIGHIKEVGPGHGVSYGKTYITSREKTRIATITVGYGDGYPRALSNKGRVLIAGQYAPIIGRVCMDQFMVDVTEIPEARVEDEVTLVGTDGENRISVEELCSIAGGTFNYEFVCDINNARVHRVFKGKRL